MPVRALAENESIRDWDLAAVVKSALLLDLTTNGPLQQRARSRKRSVANTYALTVAEAIASKALAGEA